MKKKVLIPATAFAMMLSLGLSACGDNKPKEPEQKEDDKKAEKIVITAAGDKKKLTKGEDVQLTASVEGVTWTSTKSEVATVDKNGKVTSVGKGSTTIKAEKDGYTAGSITITVELEKIVVTAADNKTALLAEETVQLTADKDGVSWESSDTSVATVSATGLVTAVKFGSATIKAIKDGYDAGSITINVNRPTAIATLKMEDADHYAADGWWGTAAEGATPIYARSSGNASDAQCIAHMDNGDKETLTFSSNAAVKAEITVKMASSSAVSAFADVMEIKFNGTAVALEGGYEFASSSEFVEISLGELNVISGNNVLEFSFKGSAPYMDDVNIYSKATATIATVAAPAKTTIAVENDNISVAIGGTASINVTTPTDKSGITYVSDKENVATVDANGVVTAHELGTANIIVKKDGMISTRVKVSATDTTYEGEIRLEAEAATESSGGWMSLTDSTSGITRGHSGGGYLSGYQISADAPGVLTFKFTSETAKSMDVFLGASAAYQATDDFSCTDSLDIQFNGTKFVTTADAKVPAGDGGMSAKLVDVYLGKINVVAGENTFVATFTSKVSVDVFKLIPEGAKQA